MLEIITLVAALGGVSLGFIGFFLISGFILKRKEKQQQIFCAGCMKWTDFNGHTCHGFDPDELEKERNNGEK